ncbi:serine hydrolase [Inhella sp.]|uniref:serine hydrolase n=1 Tax=Inhella sp. TaxID=1921806 RepID=UPI0035AFBC8A
MTELHSGAQGILAAGGGKPLLWACVSDWGDRACRCAHDMRRAVLRQAIAKGTIALIGLLAADAFAASKPDLPHPDAQRLLDLWLGAQQRSQRLPALSVAVQLGEGPVWSRGYGFIDRAQQVPARGDTLYGICSISKVFTALAVMRQVEQGRYRLDDDMALLLPDAGLPAASSAHGAVTVRSLLTHAGGLAREAPFPYWEPPAFRFPTRAELLARAPEALHAPRQHLHYSNHGMALLGELVARQGGAPFGDWVSEQLLQPLALHDTRPQVPAALLGTRLAQGWSAPGRDGRRQPLPAIDARAMAPSAGFSSSVADLVRFGHWQLQALRGQALAVPVSPAGLREMHRLQFQDPQDKRQRGLAWRLSDEGNERVLMHDGHCPGQLSLLALVPARGLVLALAMNAHHPAWIDDLLGRPARSLLLRGAALPPPDPQLAEYAGRYDESPWTSETWLLPWGDQLLMLSLPTADPMQDATRFARAGPDAFRALRDDGSLGEWLRFERDAQGRVSRALLSHQGMRKLE